jgi:hypothetical protein
MPMHVLVYVLGQDLQEIMDKSTEATRPFKKSPPNTVKTMIPIRNPVNPMNTPIAMFARMGARCLIINDIRIAVVIATIKPPRYSSVLIVPDTTLLNHLSIYQQQTSRKRKS